MEQMHNTVGSSTYEAIKRDIITGKLAPGKKLKLQPMKENYQASVSTLRETLSRLASEGFVSAEEQRGFYVTPVSREDLIEIANLRKLIETTALEASIKNGDADWEGNLVAAHHKLHLMEEKMLSGDESQRETWKRYDWEFHLATIQACNSKNLLNLHSVIYDKYLRYQMLVLSYRGEIAAKEHKEIFDYTLSRNAVKAKEALALHINNGLQDGLENFNF